MAGFLEYLQIVIDADAKGAVKGFGQSAAAAETTGKSFLGFRGATLGVIAGVAALGVGILKSVEAYDQQQLAVLKLHNSLTNSPVIINASTRAFEEQASAIQSRTAAADEDIISAQAMLATFQMTRSEIMGLTPLVVDYARKFDTDLVAAAKQVGKAFDGQVGALKRNGVTIDENLFKTDRYAAIIKALRSQVGGFAEQEVGTFSGAMQRLKNQFGEVAERIGEEFGPALTDLANGLADIIGPITSIVGPLGDFVDVLDEAGETMGAGLGRMGDDIHESLGTATLSLGYLGAEMKDNLFGAERLVGAFGAQADALNRTSTEIWALIDAQLALEGAQIGFERQLANYNTVMGDATKSDLDRREAQYQLETQVRAVARAAGEQAVADLGPNAQAKEQDRARTEAQTAALQIMAAQTSGPVKASILQHILDLSKIPPEKRTEIQALINSGQLSAAEAALNYTARDRTATITLRLAGIGAEVAKQLGLPMNAAGTDFWRGGLTWVGEKGPEIVNLPRGAQIIPANKSAAMARRGTAGHTTVAGGGTVFNVSVNAGMGADGAEIGREIVDKIQQYENRNGARWRSN